MPTCEACGRWADSTYCGVCDGCWREYETWLDKVDEAEEADMANEAHITINTNNLED